MGPKNDKIQFFLETNAVIGRNLGMTGSDQVGAGYRRVKRIAGGPGEGHRGLEMANYGQILAIILAIVLATPTTLINDMEQ